MSEHADADAPGQYTVSYRMMDMIVAVLFMVVAAVVMWDNWRIGARWAGDGPEAGYFPFYVGLIMGISGLGTFVTTLLSKTPNRTNFVGRDQLWSVLQVLIPTAIFVALMPWLGIYVAGGLYIIFFMLWIGKYPVWKAVPVGVGVPVFLFFLFEIWFLIPLPKGPVEAALGF